MLTFAVRVKDLKENNNFLNFKIHATVAFGGNEPLISRLTCFRY